MTPPTSSRHKTVQYTNSVCFDLYVMHRLASDTG
jgi:hypothetical protein